MISNPKVAKEINELMLDVFHRIDASVGMVKKTCPGDEALAYQKATAQIVGPIVMDVLEPLYEKNPALKLPNWDD